MPHLNPPEKPLMARLAAGEVEFHSLDAHQRSHVFYPIHNLQAAVDRLYQHCHKLKECGVPADVVAEIREQGKRFGVLFWDIHLLRSRLAQITEKLEPSP